MKFVKRMRYAAFLTIVLAGLAPAPGTQTSIPRALTGTATSVRTAQAIITETSPEIAAAVITFLFASGTAVRLTCATAGAPVNIATRGEVLKHANQPRGGCI